MAVLKVLLVVLSVWCWCGVCQEEGAAPLRGRGPVTLSAAERDEQERLIEEQNRSAKYRFTSAVDDGIMDQQHTRQETREEGKVVGQYSYADGFFRRTVHYEADENGYRVVSEEVEPIGNGPQLNLASGQAEVRTQFNGVDTGYVIRAEDLDLARRRVFASPSPAEDSSQSQGRAAVADKARGGLQFDDN